MVGGTQSGLRFGDPKKRPRMGDPKMVVGPKQIHAGRPQMWV